MKRNTLRLLGPAVLVTLALTACGGGSSNDIPFEELTSIPATALASATAFTNYLASLPATDSADPLTVSDVVAPISDTDEPVAITR